MSVNCVYKAPTYSWVRDQASCLYVTCRTSVAEVQRQLADTKELYINMCHEKNAVEEKLLKSGDAGRASLVCITSLYFAPAFIGYALHFTLYMTVVLLGVIDCMNCF